MTIKPTELLIKFNVNDCIEYFTLLGFLSYKKFQFECQGSGIVIFNATWHAYQSLIGFAEHNNLSIADALKNDVDLTI